MYSSTGIRCNRSWVGKLNMPVSFHHVSPAVRGTSGSRSCSLSPPVASAGMTRLARSRTQSSSSMSSGEGSRGHAHGQLEGTLDNQPQPQTMEVSC